MLFFTKKNEKKSLFLKSTADGCCIDLRELRAREDYFLSVHFVLVNRVAFQINCSQLLLD